jgi:nickel-dependent lactate racemase
MVELLQEKGELLVDIPENWEMKQKIFRAPDAVEGSVTQLMKKALAEPLGSPRLEELLKPGAKVAVVVDDLTRPTPVKDLLPELLELIENQGVARDHVDIVIGNGTHRPMDSEEIKERVGAGVYGAYRIQNHDARSEELITMGEVSGYGPVSFNATVAQADVKITLGSTIPHVHNGFGGGPKNVMPGICDFHTIRKHHLKNVLHHHSLVGIVTGNPFLEEISKIAKVARVNFSIQCLDNAIGQVYTVLAGDLFEVHQAGIRKQTEQLGVPVREKTDVTIVSSFPYNEGPQIMKAFLPAAMVTRPRGTIFVVSELSAPLPDFFLESAEKIRGDGGDEAEASILEKLKRGEPLVEGGAMDFNMAVILVFSMSRQFRLILVGHEVLRSAAAAMGFGYSPDLNAAFENELPLREKATVSVIPAGGYIFPIISDPFYLFGRKL